MFEYYYKNNNAYRFKVTNQKVEWFFGDCHNVFFANTLEEIVDFAKGYKDEYFKHLNESFWDTEYNEYEDGKRNTQIFVNHVYSEEGKYYEGCYEILETVGTTNPNDYYDILEFSQQIEKVLDDILYDEVDYREHNIARLTSILEQVEMFFMGTNHYESVKKQIEKISNFDFEKDGFPYEHYDFTNTFLVNIAEKMVWDNFMREIGW